MSTESGISDRTYKVNEAVETSGKVVKKTAKTIAGFIPVVGTGIGELVDPFMNLMPNILEENVAGDIRNIDQLYKNKQLTEYQYTKRVANTIIDSRMPDDIKIKYLPLCIDTISEHMLKSNENFEKIRQLEKSNKKISNNFKIFNNDLFKTSQGIKQKLDVINSNVDNIRDDLKSSNVTFLDIKNDMNQLFENIDINLENNYEKMKNNNFKILNSLNSSNNFFIQEWINNEISDYLDDPKIASYKIEMDQCKNPKELINISNKIKDRKFQISSEKLQFDKNIEICDNIVNCAAITTAFFGDRDIANKILITGTAAVKIWKNISSITRLTSGIAKINPFTAVTSMLGSVLSVIDIFNNNTNDDTFFKIINQMFEQIQIIRKEMHERFDKIDKKIEDMFNMVFEGFNNLQRSHEFTNLELIAISSKIDRMDTNIKHNFLKVFENIQNIFNNIKDSKHNKLLESLTSSLYVYINEDIPNNQMFIKRVKKLESYVVLTSTKYTYKDFPHSTCTALPADYDFSINKFLEYFSMQDSSISNQTLYVIASLSVLLLTLRQYPTINSSQLFKISKYDIQRLKLLLDKGIKLKNIIREFKNKILLQDILENYQDTLVQCKQKVRTYTENYEKELVDEYNNHSCNIHISRYSNLSDFELFKKQLDLTPPTGSNWYSNYWWEAWHEKGHGAPKNNNHIQHLWSYRNDQIKNIQNSIDHFKQKYVNSRRSKAHNFYKNEWVNLVSNSKFQCKTLELPWFIHPVNDEYPLLPVCSNLKAFISNEIKECCFIKNATLKFIYEIKDKVFQINFFILINSENIKFCEIYLDYNPGIFTGPQAVWWYWVGGYYCNQKSVPVINFHQSQWGSKSCDILHCHASIPILSHHTGIIDNFPILEIGNFCYDTQSILKIKELVKFEYEKVRVAYLKNLSCFISENMNSLTLNYNLVLSYISMCYRDKFVDFMEIIEPYIFDKTGFYTKYEKNSYIFTSKVLTTDKIIKIISDKYNLDDFYNDTLQFTLDTITNVINHYDGYCVEYNKWYQPAKTGEMFDSMLKETSCTLAEILNLACTCENVESSLIKEKMKNLQNKILTESKSMDDHEKEYTLNSLKSLLNSNNQFLLQ